MLLLNKNDNIKAVLYRDGNRETFYLPETALWCNHDTKELGVRGVVHPKSSVFLEINLA